MYGIISAPSIFKMDTLSSFGKEKKIFVRIGYKIIEKKGERFSPPFYSV
jgi:hypothetical protein